MHFIAYNSLTEVNTGQTSSSFSWIWSRVKTPVPGEHFKSLQKRQNRRVIIPKVVSYDPLRLQFFHQCLLLFSLSSSRRERLPQRSFVSSESKALRPGEDPSAFWLFEGTGGLSQPPKRYLCRFWPTASSQEGQLTRANFLLFMTQLDFSPLKFPTMGSWLFNIWTSSSWIRRTVELWNEEKRLYSRRSQRIFTVTLSTLNGSCENPWTIESAKGICNPTQAPQKT